MDNSLVCCFLGSLCSCNFNSIEATWLRSLVWLIDHMLFCLHVNCNQTKWNCLLDKNNISIITLHQKVQISFSDFIDCGYRPESLLMVVCIQIQFKIR